MPPIARRREAIVVCFWLSPVIVPLALRRVSSNNWVGQQDALLFILRHRHSPVSFWIFTELHARPGFLRDPHSVLSSWSPVFLMVTTNKVIVVLSFRRAERGE